MKRLKSSSVPRRKIQVSTCEVKHNSVELILSDVIVLTSMGEEVAIEAKEAPRA